MVKTLPSSAGGVGLIPGQGAKIPRALRPKNQNIKQKPYCNKVSDLEGWNREDGREAQEGGAMGTCVYIWLICFVVQQKLTRYCEAIKIGRAHV